MLANALMPALGPGVDTVQAVREVPPQLVASRPTIDCKNPEYSAIFRARASRLEKIRAEPHILPSLKAYYREHPIEFIGDWGTTIDPRNISRALPAAMPFILFPRQVQWLEFILKNWKDGVPGITEKSRDVGVSWLAMALSCTLCLHHRDMTIGFGSSKEDKVDRLDDPDCLFYKARKFLQCLPHECRGAWEEKRHAPHMGILFPQTGSAIVGEAGDGIGRGGRSSLYFVDEAAHLERAALVEASLAVNTNSRQDMSSVNGRANFFAIKQHSGDIRVFTMHWRDDPRKDDAWYRKKCEELDPVTVAAEIDINCAASVEGVVIPSAWVQAAIGAHIKLGITPTGSKFAGFDVADEGVDKNAFAGRHGFLLEYAKSWSGKGSDIYKTVIRAFAICEEMGYSTFDYDSDGLGAGVRGDANNLNDRRAAAGKSYIYDQPFRGSGAVNDPEGEMVKKRKNLDYFLNAKAQAWWALRLRFQATYCAVVEKMPCETCGIISLDPNLEELAALAVGLSQPTYSLSGVGKLVIDKAPDGTRSPNLADAVMICYQPAHRSLEVWAKLAE